MDDIKERAEEEQKRLTAILKESGISEKRMRALEAVILNTAWMKAKLDDSRAAIKNAQIVIAYDNGGGQKGIRANPLFKGYESLFRSYMQGMNRIIDSLPEEVVKIDEDTKPENVLSIIRARHRKQA